MNFDNKEFSKTVSSREEFLVCTALLPAVRERYGKSFALLEVPEVIRSDRRVGPHGTVYFRNYGGETYNGRWNEGNGGSPLGTELSSEMAQILGDLQRIDIDWLLSQDPVGEKVQQSAFELQGWLLSFAERKTQAIALGISANEFSQAEEFVKDGFRLTRRIISNGDFYPRNLVKVTNRIVLVDWGYWTGHRVCFVDYLVNVAAFAFIHMWSNRSWQREFVRHLSETLNIGSDDLRKAVLIKSFEQAIFWRPHPRLAAPQVNHFRMALRNDIFA
jgi:hypothetical protein